MPVYKLGRRWFNEIAPSLNQVAVVTPETAKKYGDACARLIKLSAPNNLRSRYLEVMDALTKRMRDELLLPLQATSPLGLSQSSLGIFVTALSDPDSGAYFQEAIDCAKHGFLRAAAVMAWCAAVDRIHRKIELLGFSTFNVVSAQTGR